MNDSYLSPYNIFLKSDLPHFWPDNVSGTAYLSISLFGEPSLLSNKGAELDDIFSNEKVVIDAFKHALVRSFKKGVSNPVAESLAYLLNVNADQIAVDQIIVCDEGMVDESLNAKLEALWKEPAIEVIHRFNIEEWKAHLQDYLNLDERPDDSFECPRATEIGLEFTPAENRVIERESAKEKRSWNRAELELLAQTWSEHCKHKIFGATIHGHGLSLDPTRGIFKTYLRDPSLKVAESDPKSYLSLFHDNAGVTRIYGPEGEVSSWALCAKMETHNSPSAISPYGGASTGIVGVHRDILGTGQGAMPIANWDVLCFEEPEHISPRPTTALDPNLIRSGVIKGIEDGGNQSGIPTVQGSVVFDPAYAVKPLVYAGALGILPVDTVAKKPRVGQALYCFGGAVGADGLRGAVMSSRDIRESDFIGSIVQVANAFVQRRMTDFLLDARDKGYIQVISDNGAGGLASSCGEMAQHTGGAIIEIAHLRKKFKKLLAWEHLLSESQERMTIATDFPSELEELAKKWGVNYDRIGELTDSGRFQVNFNGRSLVDMSLEFLHDACPDLNLKTDWSYEHERSALISSNYYWVAEASLENDMPQILSSYHGCSREEIVRRFDHEVQGRSLRQAFAGRTQESPQDASTIEIYEADSYVALAHAQQPWRKDIHESVLYSFNEVMSSLLLAGGRLHGAALLDNFSWPDPTENARSLWRLVRSCELLAKITENFSLPFVSGKDSMKNNSKEFRIPETLVISGVASAVAPENLPAGFFARANDIVLHWPGLNGHLRDSLWERGKKKDQSREESGWLDYSTKDAWRKPVDDVLEELKTRYEAIEKLIGSGAIRSAKDVGEGGLITALFEMSLGRKMGVFFEDSFPSDEEFFQESIGSFVFAVDPHHIEEVSQILPELERLGVVHNQFSMQFPEQRCDEENDKVIAEERVIDLEHWRRAYLEKGRGGLWS